MTLNRASLPNAAGLVDTSSGAEFVGFADHGTQISSPSLAVSAGVTLYAPTYMYLTGSIWHRHAVGVAVLVSQGAVTAADAFRHSLRFPVVHSPSSGNRNGPRARDLIGQHRATLVYEIYYSDPSVHGNPDRADQRGVHFEYGEQHSRARPRPRPRSASSFSPQSSVTPPPPQRQFRASARAALRRSLFTISPCSCNLLFPFVTNIAGFDTGVAIANTSADPFGTSPQTGTVTLNYYGTTSGGGAAPPAAIVVCRHRRSRVDLHLSNGGNFGISSNPGIRRLHHRSS